ncbi:MAG: hypothetical protein KatS3mg072_2224 [Meiothermus sp.]|nr:MAG: hypothetical protein KatS3mg072_2224 [Meiothermus sp.]
MQNQTRFAIAKTLLWLSSFFSSFYWNYFQNDRMVAL